METFTIFNIIGISLDIIGVILVFLFGISPMLDIGGHAILVTKEVHNEKIRRTKKYKLVSWLGLLLIFFGFLLQLIANIIR